jgi:hypothetical protein
MGIDPAMLTEAQLRLIPEADRKPLGKLGLTKAEALRQETFKLERKIHDEFSGFCQRNQITIWHSNPVRKSSIRPGLPDFLCWKSGRAIAIEFKVAPNKLTTEQEIVFTELKANKNPAYVCEEDQEGAAYRQATALLRIYFNLTEEAQ